MVAVLPTEFESYHKAPANIVVSADLGLTSKLDEVTHLVALCEKKDLVSVIQEKLLPLMCTEFGATHVAAVTIDAKAQQRAISLAKILLLLERYGQEETHGLITETDILHTIAPHPLTVQEFVSCFTVFSPFALTIPISRPGCTWHFWRENGWKSPDASTEGLLYRLQQSVSPLSEITSFLIFSGALPSQADEVWRWLRMVVAAINNVCRYINDPRTFANSDGRVDVSKQMQAMCSLTMLFADLQTLNASPRAYDRTKISFAMIDKLANLRKELGQYDSAEGTIAAELMSLSQSKFVRRTIRLKVHPYWNRIGEHLRFASRCFLHAHRHLRNELAEGEGGENQRLDRLRSYRNLNHGTFLNKNQFFKIFLTGRSSVPPSLPSVAVILTLAFLLDPHGFVAFRPYVKR